MSPLTFEVWLKRRLESLYKHLDEEGAHVHANTVAVVIEQIELDALRPRWPERYDAFLHERNKPDDL